MSWRGSLRRSLSAASSPAARMLLLLVVVGWLAVIGAVCLAEMTF